MAELSLGPPQSRSTGPALVIALLVLMLIAAAVFYFNPRKTAELTVTNVKTFAPHTEFKATHNAGGVNVVGGGHGPAAEDNLYVVASVRLQDKLRLPLYLTGAAGTLTLADGTTAEAQAVSVHDISRLQTIFPALAPLTPQPVGNGSDVAPGSVLQGQVVLLFSGYDAKAWATRKAASLTLNLRNQAPQTVAIP